MMQGNRLQKEFYNACKSGDIKAVELLLAGGADINQAMQGGRAPLYVACFYEQLAVVELLLARGADINQAKDDGETPLVVACEMGHRRVVELLLDRGADINQATQGGYGPLSVACKKGHIAVVELFLDRGADINQDQADKYGRTPLCTACLHGQLAVAELLLARGADLNQVDRYGATSLSISCSRGHLAISELLILSNKLNGYTPEHLKDIITSCADDRHRPRGRANATSYSIIAYRCYKQLQSIDPSYIPDDRESMFIGYGRAQQERQTHTLLSLFFDNRKKRAENVLPEEVWRKATTYLPLSWLRNDDNTTTHQSLVS